MLTIEELREIARARVRDAEVLHRLGRHDAAGYLLGYAVEIALKARMCQTLHWEGFPETAAEFNRLGLARSHNLEVLLGLSGRKPKVDGVYLSLWSELEGWDPSDRYLRVGSTPRGDVDRRLIAVRHLLRVL